MQSDKILKVISEYELPISRGALSVVDFLHEHYEGYIESLKAALASYNGECLGAELYQHLRDNMPLLAKTCALTIEIIKQYNSGKLLHAQKSFDSF